MKDLKIFENNEFGKVRTIIDEQGEPWFVGRDIAKFSSTETVAEI